MELKELLEAIGYSGEEATRESIVEHINKNFIPKSKALSDPDLDKHYSGRFFGLQNSALAKLSGGKYTKEQLAEMGWEKAFEAVVGGYQGELETVKAKSKEGQAKQLTELQQQIEDYQKSIADYERDKAALKSRLQEVETGAESKIKEFKINIKKKDVYSSLPWKEGMTELERAGLETYLNSNYVLDLDDKDNPVIKDKEGHTIPNPKKAGDVLGFADVVREVAAKNNLLKNNDATTQTPRKVEQRDTQPAGNNRRLPEIGIRR